MPTRGSQRALPGHSGGDELPPPSTPTPVEWGLLVLGAVRRRKRLAAAVFLLGIAAAAAYWRLKTPLYRVETKILAQRQQTLPSIVRPTVGDDVPTRLAGELVHRRDNLIALIKENQLLPEPEVASADRGAAPKGDGPSERLAAHEDRLNELVLRLDEALTVFTAEGTVTIVIEWPDPQQAYHLVEGALQNFLEARHLQEITAIDEVISLLRARVATMRDRLDRAIEEAQRSRLAGGPSRQAPRRAQPDEELVRLRSMLAAKMRAIADVEEFRHRRLADLQAQLSAQQAVYSEAYPGIISLRRDIEALSHESPQMVTLREEEQKLRQDLAARGQQAPDAGLDLPARAPGAGPNAPVQEDEGVREARHRYEQALERVSVAQTDLDAARAAFKYRYNVIWPAELPKKPVSPDPRKVFGLGAFLSLLLALLGAAAPDLWAGRIVERWQVERVLGLPVIAELDRK